MKENNGEGEGEDTVYLVLAANFGAFNEFRHAHPEMAPYSQYVPNAEALQGRLFPLQGGPKTKVIQTHSWMFVPPQTKSEVAAYLRARGITEENFKWL